LPDGTRSGKPRAGGRMGPMPAKWAIDLEVGGTPGFQNGKPGDAKAEGSASAIAVFRRVGSPRCIAQQAGVLLHRAVWDFGGHAHRVPALALVERGPQLSPVTIAEFRPAQDHAFCSRAFETGLRSLADLLVLALGEPPIRGRSGSPYTNSSGATVAAGFRDLALCRLSRPLHPHPAALVYGPTLPRKRARPSSICGSGCG
jgi:hypothetical protein